MIKAKHLAKLNVLTSPLPQKQREAINSLREFNSTVSHPELAKCESITKVIL